MRCKLSIITKPLIQDQKDSIVNEGLNQQLMSSIDSHLILNTAYCLLPNLPRRLLFRKIVLQNIKRQKNVKLRAKNPLELIPDGPYYVFMQTFLRSFAQ